MPLLLGAADPFAGKWTMNLEKSRFAPGTLPKYMTIEIESVGAGIHYHSETTNAQGKLSSSTYTADYNGPQVIVMGSNGMQAPVSLKRIDANTVEAHFMKNLEVVVSSRRVVSPDGSVMTITTTSKDRTGASVTNVGVYEKAH
ncbi:MAG: hypothetical protein ABJF23_16955 [Bryobacteraceae bacterium]